MTIKNKITAIESRRALKNRPAGYFQIIKSKKDLKKAKQQIERAREKYPNCQIPLIRVFTAGLLDETKQENTNKE